MLRLTGIRCCRALAASRTELLKQPWLSLGKWRGFRQSCRVDAFSIMGSILPGAGNEPRHHEEERVVPFHSDILFQVVSDVEKYKEFVPYTVDSKVLERVNEYETISELSVGFGALHEKYKSRVYADPVKRFVSARAEDSSMFSLLSTRWEFQERPLDKDSSFLRFRLDFQFQSALHSGVADMFFARVSSTMVDAFLDRCREVEPSIRAQTLSAKAQHRKIWERDAGRSKHEALLGELETLSHFSFKELERIKHRFDTNANHDNVLELDPFRELFFQLFKDEKYSRDDLDRTAQYIFKALDMNKDGRLSLREFTAGLSTVVKGTDEERCRFWFRCFDLDADGFVNKTELYEMIYSSVAVRNALLEAGVANTAHSKSFKIEKDTARLAKEAVSRCFPKSAFNWFSTPKVDLKALIQAKIL